MIFVILDKEVKLPNGSLLVLGPQTNADYYHSICPVNDTDTVNGPRISLTFRKAVTYKKSEGYLIGKGKDYQTLNWPIELRGHHIMSLVDKF